MNQSDSSAYRKVLEITKRPTTKDRIGFLYHLAMQYAQQIKSIKDHDSGFQQDDFAWMEDLSDNNLNELIYEIRAKRIPAVVQILLMPINPTGDELEKGIHEYEKMVDAMEILLQDRLGSDIAHYAQQILHRRHNATNRKKPAGISQEYIWENMSRKNELTLLSPFIQRILEIIDKSKSIKVMYCDIASKINGPMQKSIIAELGRGYTLPRSFDNNHAASFIGYYGFVPSDATDSALRRLLTEVFSVDFFPVIQTNKITSTHTRVIEVLEKKTKVKEKPEDRIIREFIEFRDIYIIDIGMTSADTENLRKIKITLSEVGAEGNIILTPRLRKEIGKLSFDAEDIFHEIISNFNTRKRQ